jgi:hypothetical protein
LNDGAKSSLPQYRQTSFPTLLAGRSGRRAGFPGFAGTAAVGSVATSLVFAFM